jgi:hypothetical protein
VKPFTVLWRQAAVDQLAELRLPGPDRVQVSGAVEAIDALLSTEPKGELTHELVEGLRTITVLPRRVIYAIQEPDRIVDVATVRRAFLPAP